MSVCDNCAMRLFNTKHYNLQGIGNPIYGRCIVVPNVDYNAYKNGSLSFSKQVEIISDCISSTGELDNLFIIPMIRCNKDVSCEITDDIISRCLYYFANDIKKYNFTDILLLGSAANKFLNCDIASNLNNVIISRNKRRYCLNYSPFIKYVSDDKFETFKTYLLQWITAVKNKSYIQYNKIIL